MRMRMAMRVSIHCHMTLTLFDPPFLITDGNDAPARHPTLARLWRQGTEKRRLLEESQSFTIAVLFKIHTNNPVNAPPAPVFAVIDSSTFKNNRSLNEFKDLVGDICKDYQKGTKKVVLDSPLSALLTWNTTVGLKKSHLVDYFTYQQFVQNLAKSRTRKGVINITLEKAQASGGVAYIKGINGPTSIEEELAASKEETAAAKQETMEVQAAKSLELEASTIYSEHLEQALGGDGTILAAPWDPNYFYRFTHRCAFLWAKAIRDGYTSCAIPPSTTKYKREMAKNAVNHHDTDVDYRVKKRYPAPIPCSPRHYTSNVAQKHHNFFVNAPIKIKQEPKSPSGSKRNVENSSLSSLSSVKKVKIESPSGNTPFASQSNTISLLTSDDLPEAAVYDSNSDVDVVETHSTLLADFLAQCDVPSNDLVTRGALRTAKVQSWTNLLPSQQMTANVLTTAGMSFDMAKRLMDAAKEADVQHRQTANPK
ncbi:hypothetical protein DFH28DRAFT_1165254 [Melampsora americana]|nr:hypothetical protein DFH28DRAFT_1165254 [Melampsora americana]